MPAAPRRTTARPPSARGARPPAYQLYGEAATLLADRVHAERIAERSRLHGWEIRPHRHDGLWQCLVLASGQVQAQLDGERVDLPGPAWVTVPAGAVHGFRFSDDTEGWVFTADAAHLTLLLQGEPGLRAPLRTLQAAAADQAPGNAVVAAARDLHAEAHAPGPFRGAGLDAALLRLAVALGRAGPAAAGLPRLPAPRVGEAPPRRAQQHVQKLQALVEREFRRQPRQAELAAALGLSPAQLNRVCQQVLGHPAQRVLHDRLLLQAQRELAYSQLTVKQIAYALGFRDAAYFTRFFRQRVGLGPAAWRSRPPPPAPAPPPGGAMGDERGAKRG